MFKFVLISAVLVAAAVCAAPADNKPGQQGRSDGLDQAESAWNNPNAWNAQNTWGRDPAAWNHPNSWNHGNTWNHPTAWNRGYNNRYDPANRWAAGTDPWNRYGAGAGWNSWAGRGAAAGWPAAGGAAANRWNAW
ncbi:bifunctional endo-1,4-beta-xylanase XylA-like isoform X2 [Anopheles stephensi]|uniref:bifunctional endo-1,4-beta-xylanase XylA-like isoform X2 n=1 Tax=Anopheles stephensi TaxID=30069 RepID=UPI0016587229|nr:bifunctional endo-1,4-beta-xylanase XylA-like isoform X2 [Anopheles stephensi]